MVIWCRIVFPRVCLPLPSTPPHTLHQKCSEHDHTAATVIVAAVHTVIAVMVVVIIAATSSAGRRSSIRVQTIAGVTAAALSKLARNVAARNYIS